jgi:Tfp pilus assembly protein PilN
MKIINLLPKEEQAQLKLDLVHHQLRVFWTVIFLSLVVFAGIGFGVQQYLKIEMKKTQDEIRINQVKLESSDIKALQDQVLALNQNIREIKNIRKQQYRWSDVMMEIARILPPQAQINSLQMDRATGKVVIMGKAETRQVVLDTWAQLKKTEMFKDVNFPLPNLEKPTDSNFTYTFYVDLSKIRENDI